MKKINWSPELVVAVLAVVIGVCTMIVYIYQANIMSKQIQAATWPYVEIVYSSTSNQFAINVKNKGAGPAIVKKALVRLNDVSYPDTQKNIDSVASLVSGERHILSSYTNVNNRVMSPGEVINFIEVSDSTSVAALLKGLRKQKVSLVICYCSVFDECWTVQDGKVTECDDCED